MSPLEQTSPEFLAGPQLRSTANEDSIYIALLGLSAIFLLIGLVFVQLELYSFYKIILLFKP